MAKELIIDLRNQIGETPTTRTAATPAGRAMTSIGVHAPSLLAFKYRSVLPFRFH